MIPIYLIWIGVAVCFVVTVLVLGLRMGRSTQRHDGAVDVMFRHKRSDDGTVANAKSRHGQPTKSGVKLSG
jgi:hypothetical protein